MNDAKAVILYGAESSIAADMIESLHRAGIAIAACTLTGPPEWDQDSIGEVVPADDIPVHLRQHPYVLPWVAPGWRRERVERAGRAGLRPLGALIDPTAVLPRSIAPGSGAYVNAGVVLGAQITLGAHVLINRSASVGHHARLDDYATIGPGATVAARVHLGAGCFIGAGAAIASGVSIGANSVVASGASVYRDIPANVLAAGNPFRIVKTGIAGYQGVGV